MEAGFYQTKAECAYEEAGVLNDSPIMRVSTGADEKRTFLPRVFTDGVLEH